MAAAAALLVPLPIGLDHPTPATRTLLDRHGSLIAQLPSATARVQTPIQLGEMGPWLPKITVALEDHRFLEHAGLDWHSTLGAAWRNLCSARITGGASTITQQLIKLASNRQGRSWTAKLYEALAAWKLERRWSKERILAEYLNRSHYGNRLVGPEAAARVYFGKPARELNLAEAAFLAGLPQAPTRLNPWRHSEAADARFRKAIGVLAARGVIGREQAERLASAKVTAGRFLPATQAPHFVEALLRDRSDPSDLPTTLDLPLQHTAEELARAHLRSLHRHDITGAAIVILENETGAVRALVGSPDFARSQINGALAPRSCGSVLKPFLYLRGIESRVLTAATVLPDTPEAIRDAYADYDPQNYSRRYLGPVRVREALACSLNVPAVVALSRVGARRVFYDLQRWGFSLPRGLDEYGAGFILGNAEVRLLDLAAAYGGLARGGNALHPYFQGKPKRLGDRLASPEAAAIVTDILCDNSARARAFGSSSALAFAHRVAAKTGTSSGFRDAWCAGFTRQHTVAVWVGNPDGRPMHETLAIRAAAPLWRALVEHLLKTDDPVPAPRPSSELASVDICRLTGLRPTAPSGPPLAEWFLPGTEPTEDAAAWFAPDSAGRPRPLLPPEYAAWCRSPQNDLGAVCPTSEKLAILQPLHRTTFTIDPALPRTQQMLELTCNPVPGRTIAWSVNQTSLAAQPNGRTLWPLAPGEWRIRAQAGEQQAEVTVTVE